MNQVPLPYFLTFTTYGARVPGDPDTVTRRSNSVGESRGRLAQAVGSKVRSEMRQPARLLTLPMRRSVEASIRQHCDFREWVLHALNIRSNHVHAVISADTHTADDVMNQLKARATRLLREAGLVAADAIVWTRHGSTRMVWNVDALTEVVDYVLFQQGEPMT